MVDTDDDDNDDEHKDVLEGRTIEAERLSSSTKKIYITKFLEFERFLFEYKYLINLLLFK